MERKHDRAKDQTSMTISLEKTLLDKIDAFAAEDNRTRSNWVVTELRRRVAALEAEQATNPVPKVWPPENIENFRLQPVPARDVHSHKPSGPSTPAEQTAIAAETPPDRPPKTKRTPAGPQRVASAKSGIAKTVRESRKK